MKELEKTKRISISAVIFLLIIIIGFLTYKRPKHVFKNSAETTLNKMIKRDFVLKLDEFNSLNPSEYVLIDARSVYDYDKGHIKDAVNIPLAQILNEDNSNFIDQQQSENKTLIFYGDNPETACTTWMLLYQLGYENVKVLCVSTRFENNKFHVENVDIEKPLVNYAEVMKKATSTSGVAEKPKVAKKVITVKKKKKRVAEGGC